VFLKRLTIANRLAETRKFLVSEMQVADMVCGTAARSYSGKQHAEVYRPPNFLPENLCAGMAEIKRSSGSIPCGKAHHSVSVRAGANSGETEV
jgi:hypothetical protein